MEPLLHVVLPFVALVLMGVRPVKAAPLAALGVLPDLDALFLMHRSISHSAVVLTLAWSPLLAYAFLKRREHRETAVLGLMVLLSHLLMDVVVSSTPILWPLLDTSIHLRIALNGKISEGVSLVPRVELTGTPTVFRQVASIDYPLFTGEGLMISLLLLAPIALSLLKGRDRLLNLDNASEQ